MWQPGARQLGDDRLHLFFARPVHEQDELVSPEPGSHGVGRLSGGSAELFCDQPDQSVSSGVSERVIDLLQPVDVAQDDGDRGERFGCRESLLEPLISGPPVAKAGERVREGEPGEVGQQLEARQARRQQSDQRETGVQILSTELLPTGTTHKDLAPHVISDDDAEPGGVPLAERAKQRDVSGVRSGVIH